jgi:hypothetical protein
MLNTILFLLFQQEPQRLSKVVIVGAALAFITGVALVVYFYRRFKAAEKEPEEDWQAGMRALFVQPSNADDAVKGGRTTANEPPSRAASAREANELSSLTVTGDLGTSAAERVTGDLGTSVEEQVTGDLGTSAAEPVTAKPQVEQAKTEILGAQRSTPERPAAPPQTNDVPIAPRTDVTEPAQPPARLSEDSAGGTEILTSARIESVEPEHASPFDDEVFAGLESDGARTGQTIGLTESQTGGAAGSPSHDRSATRVQGPRSTVPFETPKKPSRPITREVYEPPAISPITHREPYEPPVIRRLEPREAPAAGQRTPAPRKEAVEFQPSSSLSSPSMPPLDAQTSALVSASTPIQPPSVQQAGIRSRVPAGSVLGLPAEASTAPLSLGAPSRPTADVGIGGLVNYGKETDTGGKGGTIVLLVVVLLLAGGLLSYRYIPSVNSKVHQWVDRIRGIDKERAELAAMQPKATIIPRLSEANKNIVTARGAVENISDPPTTLENLQIEVSLERGNGGPPEIRQVPINPTTLEPGQRGVFEFEYDGKRDTGFVKYKIVKLWAGENAIKFTSPGQNR